MMRLYYCYVQLNKYQIKAYFFITTMALFLISCGQKSKDDSTKGFSMTNLDKNQIIVDGNLANKIDSLLQKEMDLGFSGSVSVMVSGKNILQNGYGWTDSLKTTAITPLTGFYLASTTKGLTGVAALIAQQNGLIKTTAPLSKINSKISKEYANITIRQMLTHTSGLSNEYETFGAIQRDENTRLIYGIQRGKEGVFNYTGAGYWHTAALIEKSAKIPYEEYVKNNIFRAANMTNSNFWFEVDEADYKKYAQKLEKFPPNEIQPNWGFRASGGVITNIIDLQSYFTSLISGKLLNDESLEELFSAHLTLASGIGVGYGWFTTKTLRETTEIWSRGGEGFGHNSAIRWFRDENVVIFILTNCGQIEGEDYEANKTVSDKIEKLIFEKAHNTK